MPWAKKLPKSLTYELKKIIMSLQFANDPVIMMIFLINTQLMSMQLTILFLLLNTTLLTAMTIQPLATSKQISMT